MIQSATSCQPSVILLHALNPCTNVLDRYINVSIISFSDVRDQSGDPNNEGLILKGTSQFPFAFYSTQNESTEPLSRVQPPPPSPTWILTVLMELSGMQREGSTLSQMPGVLQVLLMMVVVLGQGKDLVIPAGVSGQRRNCVDSSSQKPNPANKAIIRQRCVCVLRELESIDT